MKRFNIYGDFVDVDSERINTEDLTPSIFKKFISNLDDNEELEIHFNSCGGNVSSGLSIVSMINGLKQLGHVVTGIVDGLACSTASFVWASCTRRIMNEGSFLMIHPVWSVCQGNSESLKKEIEVMDKMNKAILEIYKTVFDMPEEDIKRLVDAETWISGKEASDYRLDCEVIKADADYKMCAKLTNRFKKIPKDLITMEETKIEETSIETVAETKNEVVDTPVESVEDKVETGDNAVETVTETQHETIEETKDETTDKPEDNTEMISVKDCEKRVSGMQSTLMKQIDGLHKDYQNKINDFLDQLKAKDKELTDYKDQVISLTTKLDEVTKNYSNAISALEARENALAVLNAGVNKTTDTLPTMSDGLRNCHTPEERVAFLKSGNYKQ